MVLGAPKVADVILVFASFNISRFMMLQNEFWLQFEVILRARIRFLKPIELYRGSNLIVFKVFLMYTNKFGIKLHDVDFSSFFLRSQSLGECFALFHASHGCCRWRRQVGNLGVQNQWCSIKVISRSYSGFLGMFLNAFGFLDHFQKSCEMFFFVCF